MPPDQRAQCIRSFEKFASLSLAERQQFLKNAERWKLMSPSERQAWRELVNQTAAAPAAGLCRRRRHPPIRHAAAPEPQSRMLRQRTGTTVTAARWRSTFSIFQFGLSVLSSKQCIRLRFNSARSPSTGMA